MLVGYVFEFNYLQQRKKKQIEIEIWIVDFT